MADDGVFYPPKPSLGSRTLSVRASKGSARCHMVANDRVLSTEAHLELKAALVLLARPDVVDVLEQPPAITYVDEDGRERRYTFDFLVTRRCGRLSAFEVKPSRHAARARAKVKFIAGQARGFADSFHVLTEKNFGRVALHDATMVHNMRRLADPAHDAAIKLIVDTLAGTTTIARVVEASGLGPLGFAAAVRAVGAGTLVKASRGRLDYDSAVRRREAIS